jgi:purine operon repressor
MLGSAKSSVSEDIDIIRGSFERFGLGTVETISGASGGVRYLPSLAKGKSCDFAQSLSTMLSRKERILPGGYLYMLDIIYNPEMVSELGRIMAGRFFASGIDCVITVETKGIPLAFTTARFLNTPLVIVRHYNEFADGASVNINYMSGSSKNIQTMVLPLKSLKRNSRLLFVDDFMKGGGTANGILELAREFECEVSGIGVLIQTAEPYKKMVDNYFSILTLYGVDEEAETVELKPSAGLL